MRNINNRALNDDADDAPQQNRTRRRVLDPALDDSRLKRRVIGSRINSSGCWAYNAPGMPPPGPDFLQHATDLDGLNMSVSIVTGKQIGRASCRERV